MATLNTLGLRLGGPEYTDEFLELTMESIRVNRDDENCTYIEAWQDPTDPLRFMVVSIWKTEQALGEWYRSPFHMELRKRGMQGMLESYFNRQGELDESKNHEWKRPVKA